MSAGMGSADFDGSNTVFTFFNTSGNIELSSGGTDTSTSVAQSTDWIKSKMELRSSSAALSLNGTLEAVNTSGLPAADLQPIFARQFVTAGNVGDIRYLEVFNT